MDSSFLFGLAILAYILASALYIGGAIFGARRLSLAGTCLAGGGVALHLVATALRWRESHVAGMGHAPLTNMYESLVFFALCIALISLFLERRYKLPTIGAFVMPLAAISMAYASFADRMDDSIRPLVPALQSNWLVAHVVSCFIGYGAFTVGAGLGVMALRGKAETLAATLDDLLHKTLIFGFIWLSAGIISGAVWANEAWGTYWSWDPKESWSLITWFFYAFVLHLRLTRGWSGKRMAALAVLGFAVVLFTYFGVNFFLSGLHSYGAS